MILVAGGCLSRCWVLCLTWEIIVGHCLFDWIDLLNVFQSSVVLALPLYMHNTDRAVAESESAYNNDRSDAIGHTKQKIQI